MNLSNKEILNCLRKNDEANNNRLFRRADQVREQKVGNVVYLRAIIEFSNYCRRNCFYCGLRRGNQKLQRYRMAEEEIVTAAKLVWQMGYQTIVMQSGEDTFFDQAKITKLIERIKKETNLTITLSLGERSKEEYADWRKAGADRYLLRHETANPDLYQKLHPDSSYLHRLHCLQWLGELGYEVGAGFMVGLPSQTDADIVMDLNLLKQLGVKMAGIGPFIPHKDTPLALEKGGDLISALKAVALTRIILPDINIPATTALGALHSGGRELALECGANVIMPNGTPQAFRQFYQLYPGKICLNEEPADCVQCIDTKVKNINRTTDLVKVEVKVGDYGR